MWKGWGGGAVFKWELTGGGGCNDSMLILRDGG